MSTIKKFLRLPAVMEATGKSRTTIYDNMKAGTFPESVRIGPRSIAWDADEVAAWQQQCAEKKDPTSSGKER